MGIAVRRVVLGLTALLCLAFATPALAVTPGAPGQACAVDLGSNLPPSCFEGSDGNVATDIDTLFDWDVLGADPQIRTRADASGGTDDIFGGGSKEQEPPTWEFVAQSAPPKDDFLAAAVYTDTVTTLGDGDHIFFYGAFERFSNNGDANLSWELNQVFETWDNDDDASTPEIPVRTQGDLLITYDGNSTGGIVIGACIWFGSRFGSGQLGDNDFGWYPLAAYNGGAPNPDDRLDPGNDTDRCTTLDVSTTPAAMGALWDGGASGAETLDASAIEHFGSAIQHDSFGEIAIDLTEVFEFGGLEGCVDFGGLFLHSRSSTSPTSSMKDFVDPIALAPGGDCGFTIDKRVAVNGGAAQNTTASDPVLTPVPATLNYEIRVDNTGNETLTLTVTDLNCEAAPTIADADKKHDSGGGVLVPDASPASFDGGDVWTYRCIRNLDQTDFSDGDYWDATQGLFVNEVSVRGQAAGFDETRKDQGHAEPLSKIVIDKDVTGPGASQDEDFTFSPSAQLSGSGNFPLDHDDTPVEFADIQANDDKSNIVYSVGELLSGTYTLTGIVCQNAATGTTTSTTNTPTLEGSADIKVAPGQTVTCTFTNDRDTGTIEVVKHLEPASDPGRFNLLIDGELQTGPGGDATDVGDQGTTGKVVLPTGMYPIGESAGTETSLDDYASKVECSGDEGSADPGTSLGAISVDKGDEIVCTITNLRKPVLTVDKVVAGDNASGTQKFDFTLDGEGAKDFPLAGDDPVHTQVLVPNATYTLDEVDPKPLGYKLTSVSCTEKISDDQVELLKLAEVDGEKTFTAQPGDEISCTYTNTKINEIIRIQKTGPAIAYSGDTLTFGFLVTNPGNEPLTEVKVTDDKCPNVTGPTSKEGGNQDDVLDPGEAWTYTCSYVITHNQGDVNPVTNTATATGKGPDGNDVTSTDKHDTQVLHPNVAIDKTGPATAQAGSLITYTLNITNPGDVSFAAQLVVVSDALCQAPPALQGKNGDASPATFDPGDRWTYTCQVQTQVGQTSVDNVGRVEGTDANGRKVGASDNAVTALSQPAQQVEPQPIIRPGSARLRGPTGCPTGTAVKASVTGRRIVRVTFYVDGRKSRTVTKADAQGRWSITLRPKRLAYGQHAVRARIEFASDSGTQPRNLRLSFNRCRPAVAQPKFTG